MKADRPQSSSLVFDHYASLRPHFLRAVMYPPLFRDALRECEGVFADIGAGDGSKLLALTQELALQRFDRIVACDISATRVERIREMVPSAEVFVADATSLPFEDASIGFCFSDQVIEHVASDRDFALEIRRVLASNGRAFIGSVIKRPGAWYFYRCNGEWRLDPTHVREYDSPEAFEHVFRDAGLRVYATAVEPVRFPVADYVVRALVRLRLISMRSTRSLDGRTAFSAALRRFMVRVPGYEFVYVVVGLP